MQVDGGELSVNLPLQSHPNSIKRLQQTDSKSFREIHFFVFVCHEDWYHKFKKMNLQPSWLANRSITTTLCETSWDHSAPQTVTNKIQLCQETHVKLYIHCIEIVYCLTSDMLRLGLSVSDRIVRFCSSRSNAMRTDVCHSCIPAGKELD